MNDSDSQPPLLTVLDDSGEVFSTISLAGKATFRIGRGEGKDIVLPFNWVSRHHALLQTEKSGALNLIDLGSTNGTFVNNRRITTPTLLRSGDRLAIGQTIMFFHQKTPAIKVPPQREENVADCTILVSDIHGFTGLVESLGDQRVSELLQIWSPRVNSIICAHDGMVDKFLGDAVMAVWIGGNAAGHVPRALSAALAIDRFTLEMGLKTPGIERKLSAGAAIDTGEAFAGNMVSDGRRNFTVIGDVVNVTFRLEGLTTLTGMDTLLGEGSAVYVQGMDLPLKPSRHLLKGKECEVTAYGCRFTDFVRWLDTANLRHLR
jgi:adenylate cyclase